jgi:hypothetical protein
MDDAVVEEFDNAIKLKEMESVNDFDADKLEGEQKKEYERLKQLVDKSSFSVENGIIKDSQGFELDDKAYKTAKANGDVEGMANAIGMPTDTDDFKAFEKRYNELRELENGGKASQAEIKAGGDAITQKHGAVGNEGDLNAARASEPKLDEACKKTEKTLGEKFKDGVVKLGKWTLILGAGFTLYELIHAMQEKYTGCFMTTKKGRCKLGSMTCKGDKSDGNAMCGSDVLSTCQRAGEKAPRQCFDPTSKDDCFKYQTVNNVTTCAKGFPANACDDNDPDGCGSKLEDGTCSGCCEVGSKNFATPPGARLQCVNMEGPQNFFPAMLNVMQDLGTDISDFTKDTTSWVTKLLQILKWIAIAVAVIAVVGLLGFLLLKAAGMLTKKKKAGGGGLGKAGAATGGSGGSGVSININSLAPLTTPSPAGK